MARSTAESSALEIVGMLVAAAGAVVGAAVAVRWLLRDSAHSDGATPSEKIRDMLGGGEEDATRNLRKRLEAEEADPSTSPERRAEIWRTLQAQQQPEVPAELAKDAARDAAAQAHARRVLDGREPEETAAQYLQRAGRGFLRSLNPWAD